MIGAPSRRPSDRLLASAAGRMHSTRAEWAEAMMAEADMCQSERDRLRWAFGCWVASLRTSTSLEGIAYSTALAVGLGLMSWYEWSADEGSVTVVVLGLIALVLGALRPRQALISGFVLGLVVTSVIGFEALTGVRPAYEARAQTLAHSLYWLVLLAPALSAASVGGRIGRRLRTIGPFS
jgi:hypothetical protein